MTRCRSIELVNWVHRICHATGQGDDVLKMNNCNGRGSIFSIHQIPIGIAAVVENAQRTGKLMLPARDIRRFSYERNLVETEAASQALVLGTDRNPQIFHNEVGTDRPNLLAATARQPPRGAWYGDTTRTDCCSGPILENVYEASSESRLVLPIDSLGEITGTHRDVCSRAALLALDEPVVIEYMDDKSRWSIVRGEHVASAR